jgi:diaminopimelate decarboxylase
MDAIRYQRGTLHIEAVPIERIASAVGTPFYCYSTQALTERFRAFQAAVGRDAAIRYALKANANIAVVKTLASLGAGADVVSEGELMIAQRAGIKPDRIIFAGVGKTEAELSYALSLGIEQFNVESEPELEALAALAAARDVRAPVAIRVNPAIDIDTHAKIATGHDETKFGIPWTRARDVFADAAKRPHIEVKGVHVHIGSQINRLEPFAAAFQKIAELVVALRQNGLGLERIDLGGGLGIAYDIDNPPDLRGYGALVRKIFGRLRLKLLFEPGRLLVGDAGVLVARVLYVKEAERQVFVIVDAAMNDLIRPTLYEAYHRIIPIKAQDRDAVMMPVDVVGPICETGDYLARGQPLPPVAAGDLLAVLGAGAYGAVMASTYNARPLVPEVLVRGADFAVVRRRPSYDEMLRLEELPRWLKTEPAEQAKSLA